MKSAKEELIIIDNYADKTVLDMLRELKIRVVLIIKEDGNLKQLDIQKYNNQYHNLKIIYDNTYHDRYIIVDKTMFYHLGSSINHAGSKTFSINILSDDFVSGSLLNKISKNA